MSRNQSTIFTLILIGAIVALVSGCNPFLKPGPPTQNDLKMKVVILPFENTAGIGYQGIENQTAKMVGDILTEEGHIAVVPFEEVQAYMQQAGITGPLDITSARLLGRNLGLNAVVIGAISEVSQVQKRVGWRRWIRFMADPQEYITAVLVAKIVDVESGALLAADTGMGETNTGEALKSAWLGEDPNTDETARTVQSSMQDAVEDLADNISEALDRCAWKGFLLEVNGDTAILGAGQDVGIREGNEFVVFEIERKVTNAAGQTYCIPGKPKARLEAVKVMDRTTKLKVLSGEAFAGESAQYMD